MKKVSFLLVLVLHCFIAEISFAQSYGTGRAASAGIDASVLERIASEYKNTQQQQAIHNALSVRPISELSVNSKKSVAGDTRFSHVIKQIGKTTNQYTSGRCWIFTTLNVYRAKIIDKYNLSDFEFSHAFVFFYDQLEKSNLFLQAIIDTRDSLMNSRTVEWLFKRPIYDGGQFAAAADLMHKYGVVPSSAMPETYQANNTEDMREILRYKLREYGLELRRMAEVAKAKNGSKWSEKTEKQLLENLKERKTCMLSDIYRILAECMGVPPTQFEWQGKSYTPQSFFDEFVGENMKDDYIMIMNDPTREYGKVFEIEYYRHLYDGRNWRYINLPMERIKQIAIASIKDNCAMYFSVDSPQYRNSKTGTCDFENFNPGALFDITFNMDKADRIRTFTSRSVHAMSLIGVDLDSQGNAKKWLAENSFGSDFGYAGNIIMTDKWFCEFMFRLAVNKKYVPSKILETYAGTDAQILPPWDLMY